MTTAALSLQEETAEKIRLIAVYNERLTGREEARKFVIARNILNMRRQQVRSSSGRFFFPGLDESLVHKNRDP